MLKLSVLHIFLCMLGIDFATTVRYEVLEAVEGFSGLSVQLQLKAVAGQLHELMPVRISMTPQVYIHRRTMFEA